MLKINFKEQPKKITRKFHINIYMKLETISDINSEIIIIKLAPQKRILILSMSRTSI
jgi:hypothetical protein